MFYLYQSAKEFRSSNGIIPTLLTGMQKFKKVQFVTGLTLILLLFPLINSKLFAQHNVPRQGIYDGNIGNDQIILVTENADSSSLKGYFILNRGKAVEESHTFLLNNSGSTPFFLSDLYFGKMKTAKISPTSFNGIVKLLNKKRRFLFWRPKATLNFSRRPEVQVNSTDRYKKEIFGSVEVKRDLLYGKAKGLWTRSPYSDDPYIEVLGKGLVKSFNDPEMMNLNLDIYYPKTDLFKNRPLVMLIHGGAF